MNLISKKDLLAVTGISYGQLYRWKRQQLIPDEWFLKQSSYTGQETFFPREQILSRVQSILDLKDQYSMEELAKILSPESADASFPLAKLEEISELAPLLPLLPEIFGRDCCEFIEIVCLLAISEAAKLSGLSEEQAQSLLRSGVTPASRANDLKLSCVLFSIGGQYAMAFTRQPEGLLFDAGIVRHAVVSLAEISSRLKLTYRKIFTE